jgi:hypothetical protein
MAMDMGAPLGYIIALLKPLLLQNPLSPHELLADYFAVIIQLVQMLPSRIVFLRFFFFLLQKGFTSKSLVL